MKTFLRVFSIAFVCFVLLFTSAVWAFNNFMKDNHPNANIPVVRDLDDSSFEDLENGEVDELKRLVRNSKRVNMIVLGLDETRSDTMILVSYDPDSKKADMISIPRDTYYPRAGFNSPAKKKINSVYGDHGARGVKSVASDLFFNIPVDYYITLNYRGVASIVDSIDGVPVYIPEKMDYTDRWDNPPLRIYFESGHHVLNGEDAVKFLRYRQPNPGSGAMDRRSDLGRIQAQQQFIQEAIKRALTIGNIPSLATNAFRFVRTDIELHEMTRLATSVVGIDTDNISMHTLPGTASYQGGVSYFFHDAIETRELLIKIYSGKAE